MAVNTIGDLAMSAIFRSRNAELRSEIERVSKELSTGMVASVSDAVNADFGPVSSLEYSLSQLKAYRQSMSETAGFADAMQSSLETVRQSASGLSTDLISAGSAGNTVLSASLGTAAVQAFHATVGQLNTSIGGRSLFAGTATDSAALVDSSVILTALETAVASETSASGVKAVVDAWFAPGGAFDTVAYAGSTTALTPSLAGSDLRVDLGITAADGSIRDLLRGLALSALIASPPLSGAPAEKATAARLAGDVLLQANSDLIETQARIGVAEEALQGARTRNAIEIASLELGLSQLLSVDAYEAATSLEHAETSLELLYALTARTARMKLTDYL